MWSWPASAAARACARGSFRAPPPPQSRPSAPAERRPAAGSTPGSRPTWGCRPSPSGSRRGPARKRKIFEIMLILLISLAGNHIFHVRILVNSSRDGAFRTSSSVESTLQKLQEDKLPSDSSCRLSQLQESRLIGCTQERKGPKQHLLCYTYSTAHREGASFKDILLRKFHFPRSVLNWVNGPVTALCTMRGRRENRAGNKNPSLARTSKAEVMGD